MGCHIHSRTLRMSGRCVPLASRRAVWLPLNRQDEPGGGRDLLGLFHSVDAFKKKLRAAHFRTRQRAVERQPCEGCNTRKLLPPFDQTRTSASCPCSTLPSSRDASEADCTGRRLTSRITSPRCKPALSAGLPG